MMDCRSEGILRAYLDRELPAEELDSIAAHVKACPLCGAGVQNLSARAENASALLAALPDFPVVGQAILPADLLSSRSSRLERRLRAGLPAPQRWALVLVAAASVLLIVYASVLNRGPKPAGHAYNPAPGPIAAITPPAPEMAPSARETAPPAPVRRRRATPPTAPKQEVQYFIALDNEPFEVGVVMRVALGPQAVPADVVFGTDGRARAVRLVSTNDFRIQGDNR